MGGVHLVLPLPESVVDGEGLLHEVTTRRGRRGQQAADGPALAVRLHRHPPTTHWVGGESAHWAAASRPVHHSKTAANYKFTCYSPKRVRDSESDQEES